MDNGSNAAQRLPNPEAIARFKVLTSNYGAQYASQWFWHGRNRDKIGRGSSFHGSAFEYLQQRYLSNARSWEQGQNVTEPKAPYKNTSFGCTIGGPIYIPNHLQL